MHFRKRLAPRHQDDIDTFYCSRKWSYNAMNMYMSYIDCFLDSWIISDLTEEVQKHSYRLTKEVQKLCVSKYNVGLDLHIDRTIAMKCNIVVVRNRVKHSKTGENKSLSDSKWNH